MHILLLVVVALIPLIIKLFVIVNLFQNIKTFIIIQSILHDSLIYLFLVLLTYLSYISKNIIIKIFLRFLSITIFIIYLIDSLIWVRFATHLTVEDLFKFINYLPNYISQYYNLNIYLIIFIIAFIITIFYYLFKDISIKKHYHISTIIIICLFFTSYLSANNNNYIHSWLYKNVFEYNYELLSREKKYTDNFINNLHYEKKELIHNSDSKKHNIVVLMVESLSSYQSNLFSGINNWTTEIDKIAKENIYFKNFYANGYITEHAEISILTGELPIVPPQLFSKDDNISFNGFYNVKTSIPNILKNSNYDTEFITSSDLSFSNTGTWAKSIGFNYIEGSDHPFYNNLPRFHFFAASDKYLFERVIKRMNKKRDNPYFIFVKTVSSHVPFINPENKKHSEEETFKYIDRQISFFYNKLKQDNFFKNNGMLIIVGDHYPSIPLKEKVEETLGEYRATASVPMILCLDKKNAKIDSQFQQIDIYNMILNYSGNNFFTSKWKGAFTNNSIISPEYILHKRVDNRSIYSVFNKNITYNISLNGDKTSIIDEKALDKDMKKEILTKVNFERTRNRDNNIINSDLITRKGFPLSLLRKGDID
ncbi:LTA synthase family protein [Halarcobacter sp.]|uniref:LTA synthase family protein n=1 Tax=Halarcobacter sp. TaxID=2321133 RepID=UPI0029F50574|nr:LTA synthase family protein [Halarcobacter sp.]